MDESYRVLKVLSTIQKNAFDYSITKELRDMYHMALNHFKEHILPAIKKKEDQLAMNDIFNPRNSFPTLNLPKVPLPQLKMDDRLLLIDTQQKEISELKSKVLLKTY